MGPASRPRRGRTVVAAATGEQPRVARLYTRQQILEGRPACDTIDSRALRGNPRRSGDLEVVLGPFWIRGDDAVARNDPTSTIAALLDVEAPAGSVGRILAEIFEPRRSSSTAACDR